MPGKPTQTAPTFLTQVREEWASWVAESDVVAVIGVRPVLEEAYVWEPLAESNARVWYIGGKDGDYKQLRKRVGDRITRLASSFEDGIEPLIAKLRGEVGA